MTVRILVTGSRTWEDKNYIQSVFQKWDKKLPSDQKRVLVSGACPSGADFLAEQVAAELGWVLERYPADWDEYGKRAGFVRNEEMVETRPDFLVAFIRDESKGATMTVRLACKAGIPVEKHAYETGHAFKMTRENMEEAKTSWDTSVNLW
jgi:hypothetical protein